MEPISRTVVVFDRFTGTSADDCKKFTDSVVAALKNDNEVLSLCAEGVAATGAPFVGRGVRATIRAFQPDLVIYIPSAKSALSTFGRGYSLRRAAREANHVMISLVPFAQSKRPAALLRRLYPETILVPSYKSLLTLSRLSLNGDVLPLGVDPNVYRAARPEEKRAARKRYGVEQDAFVYLLDPHTGGDSAEMLAVLAEPDDVHVIVTPTEARAPAHAAAGIRFLPQTESPQECYWLADCFVFSQSKAGDSVEIPMSVIEALACGIPVLTTPFGGLRDFLAEGDDLCYWSSFQELADGARRLRDNYPPRVRPVDEFSWNRIVKHISDRFYL